MIRRIQFLAAYGLSWIVFFQLYRILFFVYHSDRTLDLSGILVIESMLHGLRMDISFSAYLLIIPTFLSGLTCRRWDWFKKTLQWYSGIVSIVIALMISFDLELFRAWGFRIDATVLTYINTPREAMASAGAAPILVLTLILLAGFVLTFGVLSNLQKRSIDQFVYSSPVKTFLAFVLLSACLIVPIRGGLQLAPMNESAVFFSDKSFANYAAINVPWNFGHSVLQGAYNKSNPFSYYEEKQAQENMSKLFTANPAHKSLTNTGATHVNVILIIWESFTAKVVASLGGKQSTTPKFEALIKEGILFTDMYASGNRSDKGIIAILSGYPAQPTTSIMKTPTKTCSLPSLPKSFKNNGYSTSFYYGGETEFANMKTYLLQQGFDKIVDKNAFDKADMNSKWGAHDHIVLSRLLTNLDQQKQPFFATLFTLSSHEPFEVPVKTVIPGDDLEHLFLNAHHYSDESIGNFITQAKNKSWWNNTLIVILADHGHPLPQTNGNKLDEFHIPMLWLGGVVAKKGMKIDTLCSQVDLASTLLSEVGIHVSDFKWSNDILKPNRTSFAYFAFSNGFGWIRPNEFLVHDNIGGHVIERSPQNRSSELKNGRSYLQTSFADYLKR
jgi:phosphoglycerol transferase MdoB-like AlkP superfamily enzyme